MADKAVMIALGTKLGPQQGAAQMQGIIAKLQGAAGNIFGGAGGGVFAGGMAGGVAGAVVSLAQNVAGKFSEAFDEAMKAAGQERRFAAYFGQLTPLASKWAMDLSESSKFCERDIGALMGQVYNMTRGLGLTTGEAAKLTQQISQMAIDFAAFQGLSPEEAFGVLEGAIAGNTRALRQYGIVFSEAEKNSLEGLKKTGDEAAITAKMMELLTEKMGSMAGAAAKEGLGKTIREYAAAKEDMMIAFGRVEGWFADKVVKSAKGLAMLADAVVGLKAWAKFFDIDEEEIGAEASAAANRAKVVLETQDKAEKEAAARAAERRDEETRWNEQHLAFIEKELAKLKELNKAAEDGDAEKVAAAAGQARLVDELIGRQGRAKELADMAADDEARKKMHEGKYSDLLLDKAKDLLKLDEERAKKAADLAESRRKEGEHLAEQYGMLSALERAQAKNVLERLGTGGYETYKGLGEKEMKYAKEFGGEKVKGYARRLAGEELGAGRGGLLTINNEVTARIELDGPSIAQQLVENVMPKIMEALTGSAAAITGAVRAGAAAGKVVAGAGAA